VTQTQSLVGVAAALQAPAAPIALVSPRPSVGESGTIPEQRLRQIVNAGSQVFGKSGYAATSMRDVAAAAGMPIATMYQYVTGKEKLLLLIFETYMAEISTALAKANDPAKTPRRRLHDCIEATLDLYDAYRRQIRLIYQEGRSLSPENRERVRRLSHSTHKVWEGILRDGIATGEFSCRDPSVTASFIPLLCSIWVVRYSSVKGTTLEKLRESILDLIEVGLRGARRTKAVRP
jgi:AcrR family transcriptional regulator